MKLFVPGAILYILLAAPTAAAPVDVEAVAARNLPAVLVIHGKRLDNGAAVQGSGCCIHPDGYILATAHQADGVGEFTGRFADGSEVALSLVDSRPDIEYALFKAAAPIPAHAALGNANSVRSGAPIVSIASPANLEFSTVSGTVSNPNKEYGGYPVLLVSLTATHGSSGGPVFDRDGKLIGLISGGLSEVDFTIVNKINNAFPLLKTVGMQVPEASLPLESEAVLIPAAGISEAELRAIEAYNRGVAADTIAEKVDAYRLSVTLLPEFYEACFNLAVAEAGAGDIAGAAKSYLKADALRPESVAVKRNLGRLYLRAGQLEDAIAVFKEAARLAPGDAQSHNDLGEAYRRANRPADAAGHFKTSLGIDNSAPDVHFNLALTYANSGQPAEAIQHFEAYLALAPEADDAAEVRAWIAKLKSQ